MSRYIIACLLTYLICSSVPILASQGLVITSRCSINRKWLEVGRYSMYQSGEVSAIPDAYLDLTDYPEKAESTQKSMGFNGLLAIVAFMNYVDDSNDFKDSWICGGNAPGGGFYPVTIGTNAYSIFHRFGKNNEGGWGWNVWWLTSYAKHPDIDEKTTITFSSNGEYEVYRVTKDFIDLSDFKNFLAKIDEVTNLYDRVGLIIIGHGCKEGIIVPWDDGYGYKDGYIPWSRLLTWFEQLGPALDFVYIDTCYSGYFLTDYVANDFDSHIGAVLWLHRDNVVYGESLTVLMAFNTYEKDFNTLERLGNILSGQTNTTTFVQYDYYSDAYSSGLLIKIWIDKSQYPEDIEYPSGRGFSPSPGISIS